MIMFYLLIIVMPLSQHPLWEYFVGGFTMIKYLGIACLLYSVTYIGVRRTPLHLLKTRQARWFVMLALMAIISFLTMGSSTSALLEGSPFLSYISFVLLFFITIVTVDSLSRLRRVLLASVGSVGLASLYLLREWQQYHSVYTNFRPGSVTGDANYFTVSAVLCLPIAFHLMQERQPWWEKVFCIMCLALTLAAVILGASRGGFLGVAAASFVSVWRTRYRLRSLIVLSVMLLGIALITSVSPAKRFLDPGHGDKIAVESRIQTWKMGLKMLQQNPLTGIGLGNFKPLVEQHISSGEDSVKRAYIAHNTYIELGAELGLIGLILFLAILIGTFRALHHTQKHVAESSQSILAHYALGIQSGLIGYAVAAFFVSAQYQKLFWLMVFISMCLHDMVREGQTPNQGIAMGERSDVGIANNNRMGAWWSTK